MAKRKQPSPEPVVEIPEWIWEVVRPVAREAMRLWMLDEDGGYLRAPLHEFKYVVPARIFSPDPEAALSPNIAALEAEFPELRDPELTPDIEELEAELQEFFSIRPSDQFLPLYYAVQDAIGVICPDDEAEQLLGFNQEAA